MIDNIADIEKVLQLEAGTLSNAISSEDGVSVDLPELKVFTPEQHTELIGNIKKDSHTAATEIFIKTARTKYELDFQGKTADNLFNAFEAKVQKSSTTEPNEQISSLKTDNDKLRSQYTELKGQLVDVKTQFSQEREKQNINDILTQKLTAKGEFSVPTRDALTIFKAQHNFKMEEGALVFTDAGGNVRKDNLQSPLSVDSIIDEWSPTYLKPVATGRAAADETGAGGAGTYEGFVKAQAALGNAEGSSEFSNALNSAIANKEIDPNTL